MLQNAVAWRKQISEGTIKSQWQLVNLLIEGLCTSFHPKLRFSNAGTCMQLASCEPHVKTLSCIPQALMCVYTHVSVSLHSQKLCCQHIPDLSNLHVYRDEVPTVW